MKDERSAERQRQWTGLRIRQHRIGHAMTQEALAAEVLQRAGGLLKKCDQSSISNWERGITEVSLRYRRYLSEALEVPMDILFEPPPDGWRESKAAA